MTREEQLAHYAAIRRRIGAATPKPVTAIAPPKPTAEIIPLNSSPESAAVSPRMRVQQIAKMVADNRKLRVDDLFIRFKRIKVVHARWEVMWHLRKYGWSLNFIGRWLSLDHSTVLHGLRRITQMIEEGTYEPCVLPPDFAPERFKNLSTGSGGRGRKALSGAAGDERRADHV